MREQGGSGNCRTQGSQFVYQGNIGEPGNSRNWGDSSCTGGAERARSLKTDEAREVDSCAGGERGDWKPHNLGRCGSVQQKLGQPENRGSQGMDLCGIAVGAWEGEGGGTGESDEAGEGRERGKHRSGVKGGSCVERVRNGTSFLVGLS